VGGRHSSFSSKKERIFLLFPIVFILLMMCASGRFGVFAEMQNKKINRNTAECAGKKSSQAALVLRRLVVAVTHSGFERKPDSHSLAHSKKPQQQQSTFTY
jgi:hypothetical protein